jgi:LL-diaminopimelate aminotransferase
MSFRVSDRLAALPPYLFVEIDHKRRAAVAAGKDVINLGIGDPDKPTPKFIIDRMADAIEDPRNHRYPFDAGVPEFRTAAAAALKRSYGVEVDPKRELIALIGSKEGLGHLPLAVVNPGDYVLVPQPGYPVYQSAAIFAGGTPFYMDMRAETGWMPDLDAVPAEIRAKASLMYLNYPNNPTAAVATEAFYTRAVAFAREHDIVIAQDAAYADVFFDRPPLSILTIDGARDVAVEFHSLSKTFNMTGWRIAFAAGSAEIIDALARVKSNLDSGQFNAIQAAGVEALEHRDHVQVRAMSDVYRERRDALVAGFAQAGIEIDAPQATFYVWAPCPAGLDSMTFVTRVLEEASVVLIPGNGFGKPGEGYFRAALTVELDRINEAIDRIKRIKW